jgi:predicted nuclease with TOPRIM domain
VWLFVEHQDFVQASSFDVDNLRLRLEALEGEAARLREVLSMRDQQLSVLDAKNSVLENWATRANQFSRALANSKDTLHIARRSSSYVC